MDLYKILDGAGLDEETCNKCMKYKQMRIILIDNYLIRGMTREEICADIYNQTGIYISLNTYHRRYNEALKKIKKKL